MGSPGTRLTRLLAARDPGRERLVSATAITGGVLGSVLLGWVIVERFHAHPGMLSMSVFLSMLAGRAVRDPAPLARLVTTALLLPTALAAILLAVAADGVQPLAVIGFIAMSGVAVWVRRYGPRASSLGMIAFIAFFFTLFMRPEGQALGVFLLIAAGAIAAQLLVRVLLLARRPRRELRVLLRELRAASLAALVTAAQADRPGAIHAPLARLDEVGQAITRWQTRNRTERVIGRRADTLETRVLDARLDTEEACYALLRARQPGRRCDETAAAIGQLQSVLARRADPSRIAAAVEWAGRIVDPAESPAPGGLPAAADPAAYLLARAVLTHARLRAIDPSREAAEAAVREGDGTSTAGQEGADSGSDSGAGTEGAGAHAPSAAPSAPSAASPPAAARPDTATPAAAPRGPRSWRDWSVPSRMAVQAMSAAALASAAGQAISASRWYWAVMTAFVLFIGATTRDGILTRAVRRVTGTLGGIALGTVAVALTGHTTWAQLLIALLAVFGMLYLGPVNYLYSALCVTTMYRMLGILNPDLLGLRLAETLAGAVIGVLSAYLVLSSSSRPALVAQAEGYFDALRALLDAAAATLASPASPATAPAPPAALHDLEARQTEIDRAVSGMSAAFLLRNSRRESQAVHLMHVATRASARLVQSVRLLTESPGPHGAGPPAASSRTVAEAIRIVERSAEAARAALGTGGPAPPPAPEEPRVLLALRSPEGPAPGSAGAAAITALARIDWALRHAAELADGGSAAGGGEDGDPGAGGRSREGAGGRSRRAPARGRSVLLGDGVLRDERAGQLVLALLGGVARGVLGDQLDGLLGDPGPVLLHGGGEGTALRDLREREVLAVDADHGHAGDLRGIERLRGAERGLVPAAPDARDPVALRRHDVLHRLAGIVHGARHLDVLRLEDRDPGLLEHGTGACRTRLHAGVGVVGEHDDRARAAHGVDERLRALLAEVGVVARHVRGDAVGLGGIDREHGDAGVRGRLQPERDLGGIPHAEHDGVGLLGRGVLERAVELVHVAGGVLDADLPAAGLGVLGEEVDDLLRRGVAQVGSDDGDRQRVIVAGTALGGGTAGAGGEEHARRGEHSQRGEGSGLVHGACLS
ncbi:hypothetical protein B4915_10025 [Leucobacter massiliensis]|uniref:Integral membrane bound transporter domain-containing protein n=1 Tax=Leucobacter massiliensis TaxID=1686285 RepID=A0A2S9QNL8_9MICO|nr:FUSC family protein [Leucobacter massiliensis]PRI11181.1 hypothetical protein B4915_10025 [Leucobacter massiliensis]